MKDRERNRAAPAPPPDISDDDVIEAMKALSGYVDITVGDFKEIYREAYALAVSRITRSVRARDVMTRDVVAVSPDASLRDVVGVMGARGISGVPVVDAGGVVLGVISEKDILRFMGGAGAVTFMSVLSACLAQKGCAAAPMLSRRAADVMSAPAVTISEETTVSDITTTMAGRGVNRLPVVEASGRLRGIVSRGDVIRYFFARMCSCATLEK